MRPTIDARLALCAEYGMTESDAATVTGVAIGEAAALAAIAGVEFGAGVPRPKAPVWVKPDVAAYALANGKMPDAAQ